MPYDLHWVQQQHQQGEQLSFVFFWGHRRPQDGSISKSCLSQWYGASFQHEGISYPTAEHWMMAEKARLFGDEAALAAILRDSSPKVAKSMGRKVKGFDGERWNKAKGKIVEAGNSLKFSQRPALKQFLLNTGDKILVEASPYDTIWGIGMAEQEAGIYDPMNWRGENLLGFALMEVRDRLREGNDSLVFST